MGQIEDVSHAVTMDLKSPGNELYLVGATAAEFGGSHLALVGPAVPAVDQGFGEMPADAWHAVPKVDLKTAPSVLSAVHAAMKQSLVRSCHDLSEGGLAVALAEMAFAGGRGVDVDLSAAASDAKLDPFALLYSESNTRFIVEIAADDRDRFLKSFAVGGVKSPVLLGTVSNSGTVVVRSGQSVLIEADIEALRNAWKKPLAWD